MPDLISRICLNPECANAFEPAPYHPHQMYCSTRCGKRGGYLKNRPAKLEYTHKWREANLERAKANVRSYNERNREAIAEYARQYYIRNSEVKRARANAWRIANPAKRNEHRRVRRARKAGGNPPPITKAQLAARFAYWGNVCWMCGGLPESVDHVKPLCHGGRHLLANIRPACKSCNFRKGSGWRGVQGLERLKVSGR